MPSTELFHSAVGFSSLTRVSLEAEAAALLAPVEWKRTGRWLLWKSKTGLGLGFGLGLGWSSRAVLIAGKGVPRLTDVPGPGIFPLSPRDSPRERGIGCCLAGFSCRHSPLTPRDAVPCPRVIALRNLREGSLEVIPKRSEESGGAGGTRNVPGCCGPCGQTRGQTAWTEAWTRNLRALNRPRLCPQSPHCRPPAQIPRYASE
jgi:hypothetical protein